MIDIRVEGLVKSFDLEKKILDGLTFQVDTGERVGLLGRNGAGKTTLMNMLSGIYHPDAGTTCVSDQFLFLRAWSCNGVRVFASIFIFKKRSRNTFTSPSPPSRMITMAAGM